ncbi:MAG: DNA-directed RNA polymerase subunit P [Candidatus Aenigmatarchaeota archaeon]
MYQCFNCGKEVEINLKTAKKVICPHCGYRILMKPRPKVIRTVKAV